MNKNPATEALKRAVAKGGPVSETVHVFEKRGLGLAPFKVVGFEQLRYQAVPGDPSCPILPGAACDYCGTAIVDTFWIESADGKRFKVGNECVYKTGDKGLVDEAKRAAAKIRREASHARDDARIARADALIGEERIKNALAAVPHPQKWAADKGMTALDFCAWMLDHAGRSGKIRACRMIERAAESAQVQGTSAR